MISILILFNGCSNSTKENGDADQISPTSAPEVTLPAEDTAEDVTPAVTDVPTASEGQENQYTLADYYPLLTDTEYIYEGAGNEFASYNTVIDYIDEEKQRIQTRTNNGGTETVRVMEIKDGKLSILLSVNECYYRDNFINTEATEEDTEVLLMEPLAVGTEWMLSDGRKRYISAVDVTIETPAGNYQTIEVTTDSSDSATKDYYAAQTGLVKSVFVSGDMEVSSTLREIKMDLPFVQSIAVYYPDADEKLYAEQLNMEFRTGEDALQVLQEVLSRPVPKDSYLPLISPATKINRLYLENNILHVDFSAELVTDMNAGAGYEALILQGITNTLGGYYGVPEILLTVDGGLYSSGHIMLEEGETFKENNVD